MCGLGGGGEVGYEGVWVFHLAVSQPSINPAQTNRPAGQAAAAAERHACGQVRSLLTEKRLGLDAHRHLARQLQLGARRVVAGAKEGVHHCELVVFGFIRGVCANAPSTRVCWSAPDALVR